MKIANMTVTAVLLVLCAVYATEQARAREDKTAGIPDSAGARQLTAKVTRYRVRIGTFKTHEQAERMLDYLHDNGYRMVKIISDSNDETGMDSLERLRESVWHVDVCEYPTRESAEQALDDLMTLDEIKTASIVAYERDMPVDRQGRQNPDPSMEFHEFDEPPRLVTYTAPSYPDSSKAQGIEGTVYVQVLIGEDGLPEEVTLFNSDVTPEMEHAAVAAAKKWIFEPAKNKGVPTRCTMLIPIKFKLH